MNQLLRPYRRFFKKLWVLENTDHTVQKKTGPMIGDGCFELIFVTGNGYRVKHGVAQDFLFYGEGIYLGGQISQAIELEILPYTRMLFLKIEPWTAGLLSSFDFQESLNQTIPLQELNRPLVRQLHNFNFEQQTEAILLQLAKQIEAKLVRANDFELIYQSCQLLESDYFDFKQAKRLILADSGRSARTIEQKFKRYVGLTPKKYANTLQIRKISEDIYFQKKLDSFTMLAHEHGYYDQAHFIRSFRQILGISPKQLSAATAFLTNSAEDFRYYTI